MNKTEHLLIILSEECAELSKQISKALRFELDDIEPKQELTYRARIISELADIIGAARLLVDENIIVFPGEDLIEAKKLKVQKYIEYAKNQGTLEKLEDKPKKLYPVFWYMRDDHSFCRPEGKNLEEIKENFIKLAKDNPYGMICKVIIINEDENEEERRVGENAHVDHEGNVDIDFWYESVRYDEIVRNYKEENN